MGGSSNGFKFSFGVELTITLYKSVISCYSVLSVISEAVRGSSFINTHILKEVAYNDYIVLRGQK